VAFVGPPRSPALGVAAVVLVIVALSSFGVRPGVGAVEPHRASPGVVRESWACGPIRYEVNLGAAGRHQLRAVHRAMSRYASAARRPVVFVGVTDARRGDEDRAPDDPLLIEFTWPDDAPPALGFAEAFVGPDGKLVGGSVYLHPDLVTLKPRATLRLAVHEFGHLAGLAHDTDPASAMHTGAPVGRYEIDERAAIAAAYAGC
jgi:hypothetical protein